MRRARRALGFLLIAAIAGGCGHLIYTSGPYRGRVIDAETRQPLAGAVVLAVWYWESFGLGHPSEGFHDALEVLTDANGEFAIPRETHFRVTGWVDKPGIVVYFPGYRDFSFVQVQWNGESIGSTLREHTVVELPRLKSYKERKDVATIPSLAAGVPDEKMPNLIRLVNQELRTLGLQPIHTEVAK